MFCWKRKGSWEEKDYNSVGAIVQGAINEQSAAVGGSSWIPVWAENQAECWVPCQKCSACSGAGKSSSGGSGFFGCSEQTAPLPWGFMCRVNPGGSSKLK